MPKDLVSSMEEEVHDSKLKTFVQTAENIDYVFNKFYHLYSTFTEVAKVLVFLLVKSFEWNSDICHLSGTTFGNSKGLK